MNKYTGKCECLKGFKENEEDLCKRCYDFEGECLFDCPLNTEKDEKWFLCLKKENYLSENKGLFYVCLGSVLMLFFIGSFVTRFFFKKKQNMTIYNVKRNSERN